MTPVTVAVEANDVFTEAGLTSRLESSGDVRLVPGGDLDPRGIRVVAGDPLITISRGDGSETGSVVRLTRAEAPARLVGAVLDVAAGSAGRPNPPRNQGAPCGGAPAAGELTSRELRVLALMADGLQTADIARELCYSERTVKNVIHQLITRLGVRSRHHAVAHAVRAGLI